MLTTAPYHQTRRTFAVYERSGNGRDASRRCCSRQPAALQWPQMSQPFLAKLQEAVARNNSLVCVGLDPDLALMPIEDVSLFNEKIVEATSDLVCAYKPNLAFYEALGDQGWEALKHTLAVIPPDIPVIADAKRGDIGNTSAAYARAMFEELGCDAMTVNAYGGKDAIEPFLEYSDKGVIIWARSSNP